MKQTAATTAPTRSAQHRAHGTPTPGTSYGPDTARAPQQQRKPLCTYCGTDRHGDFEVVSRHRTSVGTTIWMRCSCGALQVRVVSRAGAQLVACGRRADTSSGPGR